MTNNLRDELIQDEHNQVTKIVRIIALMECYNGYKYIFNNNDNNNNNKEYSYALIQFFFFFF